MNATSGEASCIPHRDYNEVHYQQCMANPYGGALQGLQDTPHLGQLFLSRSWLKFEGRRSKVAKVNCKGLRSQLIEGFPVAVPS
jgi:hypothetical protein